jgi:hypothetical protein
MSPAARSWPLYQGVAAQRPMTVAGPLAAGPASSESSARRPDRKLQSSTQAQGLGAPVRNRPAPSLGLCPLVRRVAGKRRGLRQITNMTCPHRTTAEARAMTSRTSVHVERQFDMLTRTESPRRAPTERLPKAWLPPVAAMSCKKRSGLESDPVRPQGLVLIRPLVRSADVTL